MPTLPKLNWQTVKIESMSAPLLKQYNAYRAKMEETNKVRQAFEGAVAAHLKKTDKVPEGQEPRFAYRFGKLAIAFADETSGKSAGADDQFII